MIQKLKHETKACPRCGQAFECKAGDILKCQCFGIEFSEKMQKEISLKYEDCLCRKCLLEIQNHLQKSS